MTHPDEALLSEIEAFLARTALAPTMFGLRAIGDPNLIRNLKAGRELRSATLKRLKEFMRATERSAA